MKKRQLKKYLKKEASKGFLAADGKLYYSNEKLVKRLKEYWESKRPIPYTAMDKAAPQLSMTGISVFKISERGHMAAIATKHLYATS